MCQIWCCTVDYYATISAGHIRSCPSIWPLQAPSLKTKRRRKTKIGVTGEHFTGLE